MESFNVVKQPSSASSSSSYGHLPEQLASRGFAIVPDVLPASDVQAIGGVLERARQVETAGSVSNRSGSYALRNLTDIVPEVGSLVQHGGVRQLVTSVLGPNAFMVRATLFDKTPGANWGIFWHQDLSIAVCERHDVPGFDAWTRKAGVQCVQPPAELMRQVLALRLHLDNCDASSGALRVLPGTHRQCGLSANQIEAVARDVGEVRCDIPKGGGLLMNPLLLHASSPMTTSVSRRVIHFEFAAFELPDPLQWRYRIPCEAFES